MFTSNSIVHILSVINSDKRRGRKRKECRTDGMNTTREECGQRGKVKKKVIKQMGKQRRDEQTICTAIPRKHDNNGEENSRIVQN